MNKIGIAVLLFCFIIFQSCEKDPDWWIWDYVGNVSANLNGEPWNDALIIGFDHRSDTTTFVNDPGLTITMHVYDNNNSLRQEFVVGQVPCEIGKYDLITGNRNDHNEPYSSFITLSGDVVEDSYQIYDTDNSFIDIISIDEDYVSAQFQLYFERNIDRNPISFSGLGDTLIFSSGQFRTMITER